MASMRVMLDCTETVTILSWPLPVETGTPVIWITSWHSGSAVGEGEAPEGLGAGAAGLVQASPERSTAPSVSTVGPGLSAT